MKVYGVGIIGYGFMGRTHAHSVANMPFYYAPLNFRAELRGVCSRRRESLDAAVAAFGFPFATCDVDELLAREDIDIVSICTPNRSHEEIALKAAVAGKHIYLDKPAATDTAGARRIALAARHAGVRGQMVLNYRCYPSVLRARQWIGEGRLGRLSSFRALYLHSGSIRSDKPIGWKQTGSEGGGVLLDLGVHALDLATWLCGDVHEILCAHRRLYEERPLPGGRMTRDLNEDYACAILRMENGALGTLEASKVATGIQDELRIEIHGTGGALRLNLQEPDWLDVFDETPPEEFLGGMRGWQRLQCLQRYEPPAAQMMLKQSIGWMRSHIHSYHAFIDALCRDADPSPSLEEGVRLQEIMEAGYRSAVAGRWESTRN